MNIQIYKTFLQEIKAEKKILLSQKEKLEKLLSVLDAEGRFTQEAKDIINSVGILAQSEFQEVVECLVTQALQYVFGLDYSFQIVNQIARNQPEVYFYVVIGGVQYSLEDELGGGVLDVVSFALRVVFWVINIEKTDPIIILDEPLKYVSEDKLDAVGKMLKSLSKLLDLQIIMISHEHYLINIADTSFEITQVNGISHVERLK